MVKENSTMMFPGYQGGFKDMFVGEKIQGFDRNYQFWKMIIFCFKDNGLMLG